MLVDSVYMHISHYYIPWSHFKITINASYLKWLNFFYKIKRLYPPERRSFTRRKEANWLDFIVTLSTLQKLCISISLFLPVRFLLLWNELIRRNFTDYYCSAEDFRFTRVKIKLRVNKRRRTMMILCSLSCCNDLADPVRV